MGRPTNVSRPDRPQGTDFHVAAAMGKPMPIDQTRGLPSPVSGRDPWTLNPSGGGYDSSPSTPGLPNTGGGAPGWSTQDEMQNALYGPKAAGDGGIMGMLPGWKDVASMAAGTVVPFGGAMVKGADIGWTLANGGTPTARQNASLGFSLLGGPVGGLKGIADAYAGTQYARNHPFESYMNGGNADMQAAKTADSGYRSGFSPSQLGPLYDAIVAQRGLGGAGNVPGAIQNWANTAYKDGQIHIIEPGGPLPSNGALDISGQTQIDNSQPVSAGPNVTFDPGPSPDAGQLGGDQGGGYIDTSGGYGVDNSSYGGGGFDPSSGDSTLGFARGGMVPPPRHGTPNPPGPDDQRAGLQSGEFVLSRDDIARLGPAFMALRQALGK